MSDSCEYQEYLELLIAIDQAKRTGNFALVDQLKTKLYDLSLKCGAVTEEVENLLSDYASETLRQAPQAIERSVSNGNTETARNIATYSSQLIAIAKKKQIPNQSIEHFIRSFPEPKPIQRSSELDFIQKANVNLQDKFKESTYPDVCSKECPFTQCSSWGVPEMQGQPCRNRIKTNEEASLRSTSGYRVTPSDTPITPKILTRNWNEGVF
jgi:hypothetical protein